MLKCFVIDFLTFELFFKNKNFGIYCLIFKRGLFSFQTLTNMKIYSNYHFDELKYDMQE